MSEMCENEQCIWRCDHDDDDEKVEIKLLGYARLFAIQLKRDGLFSVRHCGQDVSRCLTIRKSVMYRTKMRALSAIYRHIITVCCCSVAWANSMVGGWRRVESCTEPIRCTCPKRCSLAQDCVAWRKTPEGPIIIVVFSVKVRSTSPQQPEMRWSMHMQFVTIKMCRRKSWGIFIVNAISS